MFERVKENWVFVFNVNIDMQPFEEYVTDI